jgi:hypothetical protein
VRGPTSVSKLNPDNVYSIQSDEASVASVCVCMCVRGWVGLGGSETERETFPSSVGVALN